VNGVEGATEAVTERVRSLIAAKMLELRDRYQNPDLPDVNSVTAFDDNRIPIDGWPAIMIVPQTTPKMTWAGTNGVDETWTARYVMRGFVWVRGNDQLDVALNRYRISLALREVLLASRRFDDYELDVTTFQESYSDTMVDKKTEATIAGAWIQWEMTSEETLRTGRALGTVETTRVDTDVVPQHPALS
jgi:hypothetical protein